MRVSGFARTATNQLFFATASQYLAICPLLLVLLVLPPCQTKFGKTFPVLYRR
jgi:hypothetical protein